MKKLVSISIFLVINFNICFSQVGRNVEVKPFIDTTTVEFRQIFNLWEKYMDTLFVYSVKSHFKISETNAGINSFWYHEDVENYSFPDLAYSIPGSAMAFYPTEKEYFLGFDTRDTNMFELKSMFVNQNENLFRNTPDIIISQPVLKVGDNYKLINKFTLLLKEGKLIAKKIDDVTYYYSPLYPFNNEKSQILSRRINKLKDGFQIIKDVEIKYLVADNITEIFEWLGVDYIGAFDYNATLSTIEGRAIPVNNMILSGGGGEDYMHEIIHIYLKNIRKGKYNLFEEGIACYFGDHQGESYMFHAKRLKTYLKNEKWIDLSKNIQGYYANSQVNHYNLTNDQNSSSNNFNYYADDTTNFTYIIHAILCDMAFKKGGYNLVKKILSEEANNVNEFYSIIDKNLNIKQEDIDEEIKIFVQENF